MAELAERVHLSATPCVRRVKRLERNGVIRRYVTLVDHAALGYDIEALAFVKLTVSSTPNSDSFEKTVAGLREVKECSIITGSYDYLLRIVCRNLQDYEQFLKRHLRGSGIPIEIESMIVLKQIDCGTTGLASEGAERAATPTHRHKRDPS